jgi:hypothetical protein
MHPKTYTPSTEPAPRRKRGTYYLLIPTMLLALIFGILVATNGASISPKTFLSPTPPSGSGKLESLLYNQLPEKLTELGHEAWALDDIEFSDDKQEAMLWIAETDLKTGETIANEPQVILALYNSETEVWELHIATDDDFYALLANSAFQESELAMRYEEDDTKAVSNGIVYGGYRLPWRSGQLKSLTWSVGHNSCASGYCTYAYDFADGTMFELLAAKGGYIYHWRDTCANGNSACTNSITLEDRSTSPWTYQLYLHIAQNSIPKALKTRGAYVWQGMKIANVDDTGYSSGHHVHFMVVQKTTLNTCATYCWGKSVDITFKDVPINWDAATQGGRPRLPGEASLYGGTGLNKYTSGNVFMPGPFIQILFPLYK